ncbi:DUF4783 domain-containing protein [Fibrella sp. WM1]|uniref:DUF4783 domain-containing protein n=1 Tax=Fibrella musci TaxID=3242485 RepID=UPI0035224F73
MKSYCLWLISCLLWVSMSCFSSEANPTQAIGDSMRLGEANRLASYFDANLELRIDPFGVDYPSVRASQAELIMRSFFKKYPPRHFQPSDQGLTPHLRYTTGTYWSGSQAFRVNVLMRQTAPGKYRIHSIQVNE